MAGRRRRKSRLRTVVDWGLTAIVLVGLATFVAWLETRNPVVLAGAVKVVDGDSLVVNGENVRLKGIDAPEFDQICQLQGKDWQCGRDSRKALRALVGRGRVTCQAGAIDRYDRWLGICKVGEVEINQELVATGWAVSYGGYEGAERRARQRRKGLWAGEFDQPQDWRRAHQGDAGSAGAVEPFWERMRAWRWQLFG